MNDCSDASLANNERQCNSFDIKDVPVLYLFRSETEKANFDLSKIPVFDMTYSVCYLAVSYNPRHNLPYVPLTVFKNDKTLLLYSAYKRYFDEVPMNIEQLYAANYYEQLLEIDPNLLVKYIKCYQYSNNVYTRLLEIGKITYKQVPQANLHDVVKNMSKFDHQFIISNNRIKFDDVPVFIRLMVFTDEFIIDLITHKTHSLTDFPYTYITKKVLIHLLDKGEILPDSIPQYLLE